jgi:uncharacterized protein
MASITNKLTKKQLIKPPSFLEDNIHYEVLMGSYAYGCHDPDKSDSDIYGVVIPPKEIIFPHLNGKILNFDKNINKFEQYEQHHVIDGRKEYDLNIYNIIKYFRLCADGNPNMVDSLFVPANCILHITAVGNMIRENRKLFLSKKCWHTFKGYSYAQMAAIKSGRKTTTSNRRVDIDRYGYDVKYAYHIVRLLSEVEQILVEGDLDLQLNREQLKSIRRGEWKLEDILTFFNDKEKQLEQLYLESKSIPDLIQEDKIKQLLVDCLEHHYGSLDKCIQVQDRYKIALDKIENIIREIK